MVLKFLQASREIGDRRYRVAARHGRLLSLFNAQTRLPPTQQPEASPKGRTSRQVELPSYLTHSMNTDRPCVGIRRPTTSHLNSRDRKVNVINLLHLIVYLPSFSTIYCLNRLQDILGGIRSDITSARLCHSRGGGSIDASITPRKFFACRFRKKKHWHNFNCDNIRRLQQWYPNLID